MWKPRIRDIVWEIYYWDLRTQNNAKPYFFLNEINKKVLPAIYSAAVWCLFVVLLFFWLYCVTTVTPFIERSEGWSLPSVGVLDQSQKQCRFFRRNSNPLRIFQLQPKKETSSSSLGDRLEKKIHNFPHQIEPFVPDFEASLAFVQCLWPLSRLPRFPISNAN